MTGVTRICVCSAEQLELGGGSSGCGRAHVSPLEPRVIGMFVHVFPCSSLLFFLFLAPCLILAYERLGVIFIAHSWHQSPNELLNVIIITHNCHIKIRRRYLCRPSTIRTTQACGGTEFNRDTAGLNAPSNINQPS